MNVVNLGFARPSIAQDNSNIPTNENVDGIEQANSTFDQMLDPESETTTNIDSDYSRGLTEDTDENDVSQRRAKGRRC